MSEKLNSNRDGAIRLFEAMSGVDEKYLVACENSEKTAPKGVVVFMQKYGKAMAAVLCLAVLGAGYVAMQTGVKYSESAASEAPQAVAGSGSVKNEVMNMDVASSEAAMEESVLENAGEASEKNDAFVSGSTTTDGAPEAEMEKGEQVQQDADPDQSVQTSPKVELTLAEAQSIDVVGRYVPTNWPADGELSQVLGSATSGEEAVTLFWTYENYEEGFSINIENLGEELPGWVTKEISEDHIVFGEDFTKEYVESQMKSSSETNDKDMPTGCFGVLYEDISGYVLVRFNGSGNADEIRELMN